jgi:hypothetical protein
MVNRERDRVLSIPVLWLNRTPPSPLRSAVYFYMWTPCQKPCTLPTSTSSLVVPTYSLVTTVICILRDGARQLELGT